MIRKNFINNVENIRRNTLLKKFDQLDHHQNGNNSILDSI